MTKCKYHPSMGEYDMQEAIDQLTQVARLLQNAEDSAAHICAEARQIHVGMPSLQHKGLFKAAQSFRGAIGYKRRVLARRVQKLVDGLSPKPCSKCETMHRDNVRVRWTYFCPKCYEETDENGMQEILTRMEEERDEEVTRKYIESRQ